MMPATPPTPPAASQAPMPLSRRPLFTPYVVMWTIGGVLAITYLAIAASMPDLIEDLSPASSQIAEPQSNQGQRAAARLAAEINGLRDSISQVQLELAKLKTDVSEHGVREKQLTGQLAALERKLSNAERPGVETANPTTPNAAGEQTVAAPTTEPGELPPELRVEAPGLTLTPPTTEEARASLVPTQPKLINADASGRTQVPVETASVKTAAKTPAPGNFTTSVVKPPAKPLGVLLSSGASLDSLRLSWSLLADRHGDALKNMEARYQTSGNEQNPNFDLVAGPIKSRAEALKVCKTLAARNIPCKVGDFAGDAL